MMSEFHKDGDRKLPTDENRHITWRIVFNSDLKEAKWGCFTNASLVAESAGYKYLTWNGWVVDLNSQRQFLEEHLPA